MRNLTLKEVQQRELMLLKEVHSFCEKNGITYFLCGGTLLGAVRHKGFIPWDDDVDIFMPRPDYEKFIRISQEYINENPNRIVYIPGEKKYLYPFIKVIDTSVRSVQELRNSLQTGLWIDIFPIDGMSDNQKDVERLYKRINFITKFFSSSRIKRPIIYGASFFTKLAGIPVNLLSRFLYVTCNFPPKRIDKLAKKIPFETAKKVGCAVWGYGIKEVFEKKCLFPPQLLQFEDAFFYAPADYEPYLINLYNDYMQLPPEEDRRVHCIGFYVDD